MKLLIAREDLLDEVADALSDRSDLDTSWHAFAEAVLAVLERHGVTFEEPAPSAGHEWTALPFWSCRCPALPGDACPLTIEECAERSRERHTP